MTSEVDPAATLGLRARTQREIIQEIRDGLPVESLHALEKRLGLNRATIASLLRLPASNFARRLNERRLPTVESEALYRIARIYAMAVDVLGSEAKAKSWLEKQNAGLGAVKPLALLDTEEGGRAVEDALGRIAHGVFA
jgi:putative toxin-antitoxin system antitoxin component (TIGR02293 family)